MVGTVIGVGLSHVQFGERVKGKGWCLFGETLLGVGDHDTLSDTAQHVVHHEEQLCSITNCPHHHFAHTAGNNFPAFHT